MRATDRLSPCFGEAKVLHLALFDQFFHRASHVFDWHVRINAVLIKQIDGIDLEALERCIRDLLDMLWAAVEAWRSLHPSGIELRIKIKPEFCCNHNLSAKGSEGFAYKFFICEWAVHFGSVEERDAAL